VTLTQLRHVPLSAKIGLTLILAYAVLAIFAPLIAPFAEREVVGRVYQPWAAPYYLGTDAVGRDVLSRLIFGARNTVGIALATTVLAFLLGTTFGLLAATVGGWVDAILSRVVDVLMAIPALIFALLILTITGTNVIALVLVIASGGAGHLDDGLHRGGADARRGPWVDHPPRDPSECRRAADSGIRFALLLRFSLHLSAQLPRARAATSHRRLGLDGA
jgi:hypothetical protein